MRKLLLLAAVPLFLAPPALADQAPERPSVCRAPDLDLSYDTQAFTAVVSLPASGCESREHRQFTLSASISRLDASGGRDVADWSTVCGPFRAASDFDDGHEPPRYSCNLGVFLDHPTVEDNIRYDVEVTYPASSGEQTMRRFTVCTSDGETAVCEQ